MRLPANEVEQLLADAGPTVSVSLTAACMGISRSTAYDYANRDELGVPVLRLGRRTLRIPTAELRKVLGLAREATSSSSAFEAPYTPDGHGRAFARMGTGTVPSGERHGAVA
jgi:hypothetical protein